jgi:hypothetical protein
MGAEPAAGQKALNMTSVLARLRELEAKATPGPWFDDLLMVPLREFRAGCFSGRQGRCAVARPEDAVLIAESRNHLAALLDVAEEADELLACLPDGLRDHLGVSLQDALARLEDEA